MSDVSTITIIIRPNGEGTTQEWQLSTGSTHYVLVDDVVESPTESGTSDYVHVDSDDDNAVEQFAFEHPQQIHTVTSITLYALVKDASNSGIDFHLNINPDGGGLLTESDHATDNGNWNWWSNTWDGFIYNVGDMANFQGEISVDAMFGIDELQCAVMYAELTGYPYPPIVI